MLYLTANVIEKRFEEWNISANRKVEMFDEASMEFVVIGTVKYLFIQQMFEKLIYYKISLEVRVEKTFETIERC